VREFTATELHAYLQATENPPLLLDVREEWEFDKACIEGSTLLPMRTVPDHLHDLDPHRETVVICHHGIRSRMIGLFLEKHGFSNLINLSGGVAAWARDVDQQMPTY
jgi:rhodanese-related sulfurtransferase